MCQTPVGMPLDRGVWRVCLVAGEGVSGFGSDALFLKGMRGGDLTSCYCESLLRRDGDRATLFNNVIAVSEI